MFNMRKLFGLFVVLSMLFVSGCAEQSQLREVQSVSEAPATDTEWKGWEPVKGFRAWSDTDENKLFYSEVVIGKCTYLVTRVHAGDTLAHKGDCPNPIHVYHSNK